jgi:hypothetical protein
MPESLDAMQQNIWVHLMKPVLVLVLAVSLLASAAALVIVADDLRVRGEAWDGLGVLIGGVVLAVALPSVAACAVVLRLLRKPDPARGVVGAAVVGVLLVLLPIPVTSEPWLPLAAVGGLLVLLAVLAASERG